VIRHVFLAAGENREISLVIPEMQESVAQVALSEFILTERQKGVPNLLCWIVPGEEPTERILGELRQNQDVLKKLQTAVMLFSKGGRSSALDALQAQWPQVRLAEESGWEEKLKSVCACVSYDPEMPPLALAFTSQEELIYADGGFNAGCVELIARTLLKKEKN